MIKSTMFCDVCSRELSEEESRDVCNVRVYVDSPFQQSVLPNGVLLYSAHVCVPCAEKHALLPMGYYLDKLTGIAGLPPPRKPFATFLALVNDCFKMFSPNKE
jgi:hypothetical protein